MVLRCYGSAERCNFVGDPNNVLIPGRSRNYEKMYSLLKNRHEEWRGVPAKPWKCSHPRRDSAGSPRPTQEPAVWNLAESVGKCLISLGKRA